MKINPELLALAEWRVNEMQKQAADKSAFVPPGAGGDPSGGGGDPSMGGGPPPGAGAPADPSAGGAPPMDPSMAGGGGGGAVPGGGGLNADSIAQIVTQTMQQQGAMGGAGGAAGGMAGKPAKANLEAVAIDIFQVKKMLQYLFNTMGIQLPPDILDGPNRDPSTGMPMSPGAPGSTSDPAVTAQNAQQMPQGGGGGGQQGGAIPPIQPMQAGGPGAGGGGEKAGADTSLHMGGGHNDGFDPRLISRAAALSAIVRKLSAKGQ